MIHILPLFDDDTYYPMLDLFDIIKIFMIYSSHKKLTVKGIVTLTHYHMSSILLQMLCRIHCPIEMWNFRDKEERVELLHLPPPRKSFGKPSVA